MLTASDVAAVLGLDERRSAVSVFAVKRGAVDEAATDWMEFGRDVEGAIANGYRRRTAREVADLGAHEIQRHPDLPWLGATLDRLTAESAEHPRPEGVAAGSLLSTDGVPLEAKAVMAGKAKAWKEDPPLPFQVQLQIQLACTGAQWGALVALIGGVQIVWRDMVRNDRFLAAILPKLEEFWIGVKNNRPPRPDDKASTLAALKALWPVDDGSTVELGDDALELLDARDRAFVVARDAKREARRCENELRALMGAAAFARLPGRQYVALETKTRAGYTRVVKPTTYRTLRRWYPPRQHARRTR